MYGAPTYTVKEGGVLKKKLQPYAATKTQRGPVQNKSDAHYKS